MSAVMEAVVPSGCRTGAGKDEAPPAAEKNDTTGITGITNDATTTGAGKDGAASKDDAKKTDATGITGNSKDATTVAGKDGAKKSESVVDTEGSDFEQWSQCGLEDDKDELELYVPPPRIKTSKLTPDEKARCKRILDRIFTRQCAVMCEKIVFHPGDIKFVAEGVVPYLDSEPVLIEDLTWPITIVGDIHGQLHDVHRLFVSHAKDGKPGWECAKFLFLGDYVDRGRQNLEVLMSLFCIKMLYPDSIFLLRGNHEFTSVNICYGFMRDLHKMYEPEMAKEIYIGFNCVFGYLSFAAIVGDIYFCSHGGPSPQATRLTLRTFSKPIVTSTEDQILNDLVWSDPAIGLKGGVVNGERGGSLYYGLDFLVKATKRLQVKVVFRGHTQLATGFEVHWDLLVSLFTCVDTGGSGNQGAVAVLDERGEVTFHVCDVCPERQALERALDEMEAERKKVANAKAAKKKEPGLDDTIDDGNEKTTMSTIRRM